MEVTTPPASVPDLSKPYCYAILEAERDPEGYVPCIIVEGEAGYWALRGNGPCATPWYWGTTRQMADELCRRANEQRGLSDEDVARITLTSFAASPRPRDARDSA